MFTCISTLYLTKKIIVLSHNTTEDGVDNQNVGCRDAEIKMFAATDEQAGEDKVVSNLFSYRLPALRLK